MSIYDDLANSDFLDPGKFREQLKQLSQLKESQESNLEEGDGEPNEEGQHNGQRHLQGSSRDDFIAVQINPETLKRQKVMQEQNPMDQENEQSLLRNANRNQNARQVPELPHESRLEKEALDAPIQKQLEFIRERQRLMQEQEDSSKDLNFQQQAKQASQERFNFENQTRMRQSIEEDNLLDEDAYRDDQR